MSSFYDPIQTDFIAHPGRRHIEGVLQGFAYGHLAAELLIVVLGLPQLSPRLHLEGCVLQERSRRPVGSIFADWISKRGQIYEGLEERSWLSPGIDCAIERTADG